MAEPPNGNRSPGGPPSGSEVTRFLRNLEQTSAVAVEDGGEPGGVAIHRLAFTEVDARRTNGHVQGIAARFENSGADAEVTLYASLSDFPPGWGACLIERGRAGQIGSADMEAMSLPQGRHPGGINICDDLLVVPLEHDGREARLYFYDVGHDPLYPRQVGDFDPDWPDPPSGAGPAGTESWLGIDGDNATKASAAGIARMPRGWLPPGDESEQREVDPEDEPRDAFLVVVLAEQRYLRFLEFERQDERVIATGRSATCTLPEREGSFVDNVSLVELADGGWGLFLFSAENLWPGTDLQRRNRTVDRVCFHRLTFTATPGQPGEPTTFTPHLHDPDDAVVAWRDRPDGLPDDINLQSKPGATERCWPGFRWGASITWTGTDFALLMAEWFGDEEARPDGRHPPSPTPSGGGAARSRSDGGEDGRVMYVQFATNLTTEPFGYTTGNSHFGTGHAAWAGKPPFDERLWRNVRDAIPVIHMLVSLGGRWLQGLALLMVALAVLILAIVFSGLTISLFLAGVGSLLGLIAAGMVAVGASDAVRDNDQLEDRLTSSAAIGAGVAGVLAAVSFVAERRVLLAACVTVALLGAGVFYDLVIRRRLEERADRAVANRRAVVDFGAIFVTSSIVAALTPLAVDAWGAPVLVVSGAALLAALATLKYLAWPTLRGRDLTSFSWVVVARRYWPAATAAFVVGAVAAVVLERSGHRWSAGLLLGWVALAAVSIWGAIEYQRPPRPRRFYMPIRYVAVAFAIGALAITTSAVADTAIAFFVVAIAIVIGAFVVWPGEAGLLLVMIAFVATWAAADIDHTTEPDSIVAAPDPTRPTRWVVALGDSFISGEGAGAFRSGTNIPGVNICRRAPTAWPDLVAEQLGRLEDERPTADRRQVRLVSFACSGATIADITSNAQHDDVADDGAGGFRGRSSQLEALDQWLGATPETGDELAYVLVSAGGNDAGFAKVIEACLLPGTSCDTIMDAFEERAGPVQQDLQDLLLSLQTTMATNRHDPTVIVNPYLDPMGDGDGARCGTLPGQPSLIDGEEVDRLRTFRQELNDRLRAAVDNHNGAADSTLRVLFNHGGGRVEGNLCGGATGEAEVRQNWLVLQPPDDVGSGPLSKFRALIPSDAWVLGSAHPNEAGHAAIAETVCGLVNAQEGVPTSFLGCRAPEMTERVGLAPLPDEAAGATTAAPSDCAPGTDGTGSPCPEARERTDRWADDRLAEAGQRLGVAMGLAAFGGVLLGSSVAHDPRFRRRTAPGPRRRPGQEVR